jgi:hypothetical protein
MIAAWERRPQPEELPLIVAFAASHGQDESYCNPRLFLEVSCGHEGFRFGGPH